MSEFAARLVAWHRDHGRHDLPWQARRDPYPVWISEIMLQQTQVSTVIPYYQRFLRHFPDIPTLATAPLDAVLRLWSGLGYYTRARNLHRAAQAIVREHGGRFPDEFAAVCALPGIGRSTAAAICAFAYGERRAILDGNVKRVLARYSGIRGYPGDRDVEAALWTTAESLLPLADVATYTQALMDLGAGVCSRRKPNCPACPVAGACIARARSLTEVLPTPKTKRALPHKNAVMLVLEHDGQVLFQRRPENGIWGGLWSLPECASDEALEAWCLRQYGADVSGVTRLSQIVHGFTHFRLTIDPLYLRVLRLRPRAAEPGEAWMTIEDAIAAAVPAPVRRILAALQ